MQKKKLGEVGVRVVGDQGGCERNMEVIVKMQKNVSGVGVPGPVGGEGVVGGRGLVVSRVRGRG